MWIKRQVVMLPTEEEANIFLEEDKTLTYYKHKQKQTLRGKGINLYILSDDEIKEGDWFINDLNQIKKCISRDTEGYIDFEGGFNTKPSSCKKIIATTDKTLSQTSRTEIPQPSQQFIEKYIEEYNNCNIITEVMVEYNSPEICENPLDSKFASLKVNPKDNTITIRKVKNSWNKEEVIKSIKNFAEKFVANTNTAYKQKEINEWIEENL